MTRITVSVELTLNTQTRGAALPEPVRVEITEIGRLGAQDAMNLAKNMAGAVLERVAARLNADPAVQEGLREKPQQPKEEPDAPTIANRHFGDIADDLRGES